MSHKPSIFFTPVKGINQQELWHPEIEEFAKSLGWEVRLNPYEGPLTQEQWADLLEGVEALITSWSAPKLDEVALSKNDTLKIVGHAAGSVARIAHPELYKRGVKVTTANDSMAESVARWSLMATMVGLRRLMTYAQLGAAQPINNANKANLKDIAQSVIGIWGYGDIARHLVRQLKPLRPKEILVVSGHMKPEDAAAEGMRKVEFDELFEQADVIHCLQGLTDRSKGAVGPDQLAAIKDDGVLINCGRAPLIQEEALIAELKKERFWGIFDVHYKEPVPDDYPLRGMPNVILTPHNAGREGREFYVKVILEEFDRFYRGEPLKNEVAEERAAMMTDETQLKKKK